MKLQTPASPCNQGAGPCEAALVRNMEINYCAPRFILLVCLILSSTEGTRQLNLSSPGLLSKLTAPSPPLQRPACLQRAGCGEKEQAERRVGEDATGLLKSLQERPPPSGVLFRMGSPCCCWSQRCWQEGAQGRGLGNVCPAAEPPFPQGRTPFRCLSSRGPDKHVTPLTAGQGPH